MILPLILSTVLTLASGEYVLTLRDDAENVDRICAKSEITCLAAAHAATSGLWVPLEMGTIVEATCTPRPGCFSPESNEIKGFNDRQRNEHR